MSLSLIRCKDQTKTIALSKAFSLNRNRSSGNDVHLRGNGDLFQL